jgi:hypothetical protein
MVCCFLINFIFHVELFMLPKAYLKINFMNKKHFRLLLTLVIVFYMPLQSMAWGVLGHRIVGEIAESYLTLKKPKGKSIAYWELNQLP